MPKIKVISREVVQYNYVTWNGSFDTEKKQQMMTFGEKRGIWKGELACS